MVTINSSFIGNFRLGDNINHNLDVLAVLYRHFADANDEDKRLLCKPIVLGIASIVEAVLYDLHLRKRTFTREGVSNLAATALDYVKGKRIDDFEKFVASARKHDFFPQGDAGFYDRLTVLRQLRNRIHIQNEGGHFEPLELNAFTEARKIEAERMLEKTLVIMAERYARPHKYVLDFELPWEAHFA